MLVSREELLDLLREAQSGFIPGSGPDLKWTARKDAALAAPDARCYTRADGECISNDCMHTDPQETK